MYQFQDLNVEDEFIPGLGRNDSEESAGSSGMAVNSNNKSLVNSLQESLTMNLLWDETELTKLSLGLDNDVDPPHWDLDPKNPSCDWRYLEERSQALAKKLLVLDSEKIHYTNPQLSQSAIFNPFAFMPSNQKDAIQLNATIDVGEGLSSSFNPRFKTEICRNYKEKGQCVYGDLCQFAHGKHELRKDVVRHDKYKTKHCQKYWFHGYCAYGPRCNFIHRIEEGPAQGRGLTPQTIREAAARRMSLQVQPTIIKTAAQVLGLANMRKANHGEALSDDEMKGSGGSGFKEDEYVGPMETQEDGLEKFPTFYPRDYYNPNIHDSFNNFNHQVGPVGSGRPDRQIPRNVWPGA